MGGTFFFDEHLYVIVGQGRAVRRGGLVHYADQKFNG
jgi:hypothetical protein